MENDLELIKCLEERIHSGKVMIERLQSMSEIDGVDKLKRKILQEIKVLEKVQLRGNIKKEHLMSTNLIHLEAIVKRLFVSNEPINVMKPFKYNNSRLEVDITCNKGASWVKVIARNAKALTLISLGNGEYGQKSVLDQAESYLESAKYHPYMYKPPQIVFHFACGIEISLAKRLEEMGLIVEGDRINCKIQDDSLTTDGGNQTTSNESHLTILNVEPIIKETKCLNLDVSTLLAYVTNMTNGYPNFVYLEPLLTQQAEMERRNPVKPILDKLFEGKKLITCKTAHDNFIDIIRVIGGPKETQRSREFLKRIEIVEDVTTGRIMETLNLGGKIKYRSKQVFATGECMESMTVSANEGFVRAARMQGIECMVFLHEPRSLSEIKENHAKFNTQ